MRAPLLVLCLLAGVAHAAPSKIVSKEGGYTVTFPAPPEAKTKPLPDGTQMVTAYVLKDGDSSYVALYVDELRADKMPSAKESLDSGEAGALRMPGTKVLDRKDLTYQGYPARDLTLTAPSDHIVKMRFVVVGRRAYELMTMLPAKAPTAKFDAFLDSLKISK